LSNDAFDIWKLASSFIGFVVGMHEEIVVALDWTDLDQDDHTQEIHHRGDPPAEPLDGQGRSAL